MELMKIGPEPLLLRRYRAALGLSCAELSRRAHMCHADVSRIERGMLWPYESQKAKICAALGVEGDAAAALFRPDEGADIEAVFEWMGDSAGVGR